MAKGERGFVWKSLRISFWTMVILWVLSIIAGFVNPNPPQGLIWDIMAILWIASAGFTFVVSIVHLTKHKEKALAITALVFSSILILLFLLGILVALSGAGLAGNLPQ